MQLLHFVEHIPQSPSHIPLTEHFLEGCLTHHFRYALQPRIAKLTKKIDKSTTTNSLFVDFLKSYLWLFVAFSTNIPQIKWPADDCSWLWHPTDEQLLTHFNLNYSQNLPWKQYNLWPEMNFTLLSALQRKQQLLELFLLQLQKTEAWWLIWLAKCTKWEINPIQDLSSMHTANYLVAFAHKVHTGKITPSGKPCRLGNVETTLHAIGQTIALLGPNHHNLDL